MSEREREARERKSPLLERAKRDLMLTPYSHNP